MWHYPIHFCLLGMHVCTQLRTTVSWICCWDVLTMDRLSQCAKIFACSLIAWHFSTNYFAIIISLEISFWEVVSTDGRTISQWILYWSGYVTPISTYNYIHLDGVYKHLFWSRSSGSKMKKEMISKYQLQLT